MVDSEDSVDIVDNVDSAYYIYRYISAGACVCRPAGTCCSVMRTSSSASELRPLSVRPTRAGRAAGPGWTRRTATTGGLILFSTISKYC